MFTDIVAPNIFHCRNDWNVKSFNCKQFRVISIPGMVAKIVKDETGFDPLENTPWRKREVCQSRQIYLVMLKNNTRMSLASIGNTVQKDHCTVINASKSINNLCDTDKRFKELFDTINSKVKLKINNHGTNQR
jgi:hypothetical protein